MHTKESIVTLLKTRDVAVARALVALKNRQTLDEQSSDATMHRNGMGFRPCDAYMGTEMAKFYESKGYLTEKQLSYWRSPTKSGKMRIEVYANQLLSIVKENQRDS